ncbi:hypothetical protein FQA47_017620 [Oryzias melastigma]|uniref:Uncharacterized protein n=1 Tax=Oryzias melastigma TaxID=30732 RepID=A0A834L0J1_ORYME|nr:hypothetical protein FQA47_017620 [Oryzias melastigma]
MSVSAAVGLQQQQLLMKACRASRAEVMGGELEFTEDTLLTVSMMTPAYNRQTANARPILRLCVAPPHQPDCT